MTETNDRRMSVFIHGWWGAGKSWLAATAPGPRLVMDVEGGFYDTPGDHIKWDILKDPMPTGLTKEASVIVDVQHPESIDRVMDLIRTGDHPFESLVLDSLHELGDIIKRMVAMPGEIYDPNATYDHQAWGRLKNNMGLMLRELRNFARPTSAKPIHTVIVCGSDNERIPSIPLLEGGIRKSVSGFFEVVGYLTTATVKDSGEEVRVLQIAPSPEAEAKCRLHNLKVKYGTQIVKPDLRRMARVVNTPQETA